MASSLQSASAKLARGPWPGLLGLALLIVALLGVAWRKQSATFGGGQSSWSVPDFSFLDQHGRQTTKAAFEGKIWIANFIFTRCQAACPLLTAKMRILQRKLAHSELRFVSFSVDPAHDSVDVLRRYAEGWAKHETRWTLFRTEPTSLQRIVDGMRVIAVPNSDPSNPIIHSSLFFLVDGNGEVRGQYDSHGDRALARLVADTQKLLEEGPPHRDEDTQGQHGSARTVPHSDPARAGKLEFEALCAGCHDHSEIAPSLVGIWDTDVALADGTTVRVDERYVLESLVTPAAKLARGYANSMPSYANELSTDELTAIVEYVRTLTPENHVRVTP